MGRKEHFLIEVKAGFRTDIAGMQLDTRLDLIYVDIAQTVLVGPQTDELMVYWHL